MELVFMSSFSEEACQQSLLPFSIYNFTVLGFIEMMDSSSAASEGIYTPYSSPELGPTIFGIVDANLKANIMCGDQPLVTPDQFEDSSVNITQGKRRRKNDANSRICVCFPLGV